jgi:hypothetical protein
MRVCNSARYGASNIGQHDPLLPYYRIAPILSCTQGKSLQYTRAARAQAQRYLNQPSLPRSRAQTGGIYAMLYYNTLMAHTGSKRSSILLRMSLMRAAASLGRPKTHKMAHVGLFNWSCKNPLLYLYMEQAPLPSCTQCQAWSADG